MKQGNLKIWLMFAAAVTMGVLLHFLGDWARWPAVYLFAPARESIWEHLKILFYPLLLSALVVGGRRGLTAWLLSLLTVCAAMLGAGWIYYVTLEQEGLWFSLVLYFALMTAGFLLPRVLWPLAERKGVGALSVLLTVGLWVLLVVFTVHPPEGLLFADLSGGLRTWLTIPV